MIARCFILLMALAAAARAEATVDPVVIDRRAARADIAGVKTELATLAERLGSVSVAAASVRALKDKLRAFEERLSRATAPQATGQDVVLVETMITEGGYSSMISVGTDTSSFGHPRVTVVHLGPGERLLDPAIFPTVAQEAVATSDSAAAIAVLRARLAGLDLFTYQAEQLVGSFPSVDDREQAAELLVPKIADLENAGDLPALFPTEESRSRIARLLRAAAARRAPDPAAP